MLKELGNEIIELLNKYVDEYNEAPDAEKYLKVLLNAVFLIFFSSVTPSAIGGQHI